MPSKETQTLYVYLGTAGIGRRWFRAWLATEVDGEIDRQDGADDGTSHTPGAALVKVTHRLDRLIWRVGLGSGETFLGTRLLEVADDIREIVVRPTELFGYEARLSHDDDDREDLPRGRGERPTSALRDMAKEIDRQATLAGWVNGG